MKHGSLASCNNMSSISGTCEDDEKKKSPGIHLQSRCEKRQSSLCYQQFTNKANNERNERTVEIKNSQPVELELQSLTVGRKKDLKLSCLSFKCSKNFKIKIKKLQNNPKCLQSCAKD